MIKNCTPHGIFLETEGEGLNLFEPSGILPRVSTFETEAESIDGFPCVTQKTSEVSGLPEYEPGVYLIVSAMVFNASDRKDLIAPDTGKTAKRNELGQIISVTRFLRK